MPAPANLAAGPPSNPNHSAGPRGTREEEKRKGKAERERGRGSGGGVPFTTSASVSWRTVVTGRLTVRLQIAGGGESVPTEGTHIS